MILESGLTESINSPFIVPVASFIMVLGIVAVGAWSNARKRELESQERLAAIAKGIPPPPTAAELAATQGRPAVSLVRRRANIRLAGIVLLGAAAGIILFFIALAAILQQREVLSGAACGLIPFGIGVGFLIDTRIQSREIDESTQPPTPHSFNS
jgi:uncharacterized membrane protein